jgi:hypothetical protein
VASPAWTVGLRDLLGAPPHLVTEVIVASWVANGLRETEQLDFKSALYGTSDGAKRELAGDLAAFANHRGGVLVLGVEETNGSASGTPGVEITDGEELRMRSIIAGNVTPHFPVDIHPVALTGEPGRGFYLVTVAPSTSRPHAVRKDIDLRYPRRDGTATRWLSESEIANLYRDRFGEYRDDAGRAKRMLGHGQAGTDQSEGMWIDAALVPGGPGSLQISAPGVQEMTAWAGHFMGHDHVAGFLGNSQPVIRPALGKLRLGTIRDLGAVQPAIDRYAELHTDGAGVTSRRIDSSFDQGSRGQLTRALLVWTIAPALNLLAQHAARSGAWGDAAVVLRLRSRGVQMIFGHHTYGTLFRASDAAVVHNGPLTVSATMSLDELITGPQGLLAGVWLLGTDICHSFGVVGLEVLHPDGALATGYTDTVDQSWAAAAGVPVRV